MKSVNDVLRHKGAVTVWSVVPTDTVFSAIATMAEREVGALIVMQHDKLVGIVSERDYTRKVILRDRSSKDTHVSEIMTYDVIKVTPHDQIADCVKLMKDHHIRHLPVLDAGRVVGMLSLRDLFSEIIDEQADTIDQLQHYIRGEV
ncbi:MAG: CBS domain-containing protein [Gammaproteobacteria bacterium]|nr:CBS domain-containing protein [Gammaproteobacteria bacterium]MCZ6855973.1 CBS domain-containing protein [Gammaproteobacteria bacterium]